MNKMFISNVQFLVAILFCILIFYGIGKRSPDIAVQSPLAAKDPAGAVSSDQKSSQINTDKFLHQPQSLVKPGAAVSLKNTEPLYAPGPGVFEYQLQLVSSKHAGKMTVEVSTSDGVTIVSPERQFEFVLQESGEYRLPLTLNANSNGRFYIQLHVSTAVEGQTSARAIAAILQVGEPMVKVQKTASRSSADKTGAVISLPAQETILPR